MYDLAINIYTFLIKLVALSGNKKAKKWIDGRKGLLREIESTIPTDEALIWIHCSSLGEFEQGRPVIENIKRKYSSYKVLLTFFSPSGYEVRKNYKDADYVFYLPADTRRNASGFVGMLNIKLAIFVKYEFWRNYLIALNRKNVPVFLVSAIFRPDQLFFKWYGAAYAKLLRYFTHFFVQDDVSVVLLKRLGLDNVTIAGDTRFDRVYEIYKKGESDSLVENFAAKSDLPVIVAGSTWEKDEEILLRYINSAGKYNLVIAPHEVDKAHINKIVSEIEGQYSLYTTGQYDGKVLIIDTIGVLNKAYRVAAIAYVGGGFGAGIHNILEAAVYGIPVVFGPNYGKFKEAHDLIKAGGGFSINSYEEFVSLIERLNTDIDFYNNAAEASKKYVLSNTGATEKIMNLISKFFEDGK